MGVGARGGEREPRAGGRAGRPDRVRDGTAPRCEAVLPRAATPGVAVAFEPDPMAWEPKRLTCARKGCPTRFTPTDPAQRYHAPGCRLTPEEHVARRRQRESPAERNASWRAVHEERIGERVDHDGRLMCWRCLDRLARKGFSLCMTCSACSSCGINDPLSGSRFCRSCREKRNARLRERRADPAAREKYNAQQRERRADPEYREKRNARLRERNRARRANDPEYREKVNARNRARRADPAAREKYNAQQRERTRRGPREGPRAVLRPRARAPCRPRGPREAERPPARAPRSPEGRRVIICDCTCPCGIEVAEPGTLCIDCACGEHVDDLDPSRLDYPEDDDEEGFPW